MAGSAVRPAEDIFIAPVSVLRSSIPTATPAIRRRRFPRSELRGHDHMKAPARADQAVAALESLRRIKKSALSEYISP
jgi:hypothetical protein